MTIPPRFEVTAAQIEQVVAVFYKRVRSHPRLGPVFAVHVRDWPVHEEKICAFWRNAILFERSYDGNPMQIHIAAGNVHAAHFQEWLAEFDTVLSEALAADLAQAWSALAHRIGRGLSFGLDAGQGDQIPRL